MTDLLTQEVIERFRTAEIEARDFFDAIWLGTTYHDRATILAVLEAAYEVKAANRAAEMGEPVNGLRTLEAERDLLALISVEVPQ